MEMPQYGKWREGECPSEHSDVWAIDTVVKIAGN